MSLTTLSKIRSILNKQIGPIHLIFVVLRIEPNQQMSMLPYEKEVVKTVLGVLTVLVWSGTCYAETISASFVFGDSLVDVGNNNYIISISKANYPPNEIDFGKPTGRFTNGRTISDILG